MSKMINNVENSNIKDNNVDQRENDAGNKG